METDIIVRALAALAQETRLRIFRLLVQAGEAGITVGSIARQLDVPNATLSFHLKELANAGLIRNRHDGRFIFCSANYRTMNLLIAYLTENCCGGAPCAASDAVHRDLVKEEVVS